MAGCQKEYDGQIIVENEDMRVFVEYFITEANKRGVVVGDREHLIEQLFSGVPVPNLD